MQEMLHMYKILQTMSLTFLCLFSVPLHFLTARVLAYRSRFVRSLSLFLFLSISIWISIDRSCMIISLSDLSSSFDSMFHPDCFRLFSIGICLVFLIQAFHPYWIRFDFSSNLVYYIGLVTLVDVFLG